MKKYWPLESICYTLLFLICARAAFGADAAGAKETINPFESKEATLPSLEQNKQKQIEEARSWKVFHDFQFSDQYEQSGIRFQQHPVDDGAKDYKAVHYDHGTG